MAASSFQKMAIKLGYPECPICKLRVPKDARKRLEKNGCCDFCKESGMDSRYRWRMEDVMYGTDAVRYERYGTE